MQVATIVPTKFLAYTDGDPYQMALAHLLAIDDEYRTYFQFQRKTHNSYVIMDNGAAENAQVPSVDELYDRAMSIDASEIVLPDTLFDHESTLNKAYNAIDRLEKLGWKGKIMAVPHAENPIAWRSIATTFMGWKPITAIGISKFLCKQYGPYGRAWALSTISRSVQRNKFLDATKQIHLLGCWGDHTEIAWLENSFGHLNLRGTDSAIAYVYAQKGFKMRVGVPRPEDEVEFTNRDLEIDPTLLRRNIGVWREYGMQAVR